MNKVGQSLWWLLGCLLVLIFAAGCGHVSQWRM